MKEYFVILLLLGFSLNAGLLYSEESTAAWRFRQNLRAEKGGLIRLVLPDETLNAAKPGLEDLRIFDGNGQAVPYLIERRKSQRVDSFAAKHFQIILERETTLIVVETGTDRELEAFVLETGAQHFIKALNAEGSTDGTTWRSLFIGEPAFRQDSGESRLRFAIPKNYWKFLRLKLDDSRSQPVAVSGVSVVPVAEVVARQPVPVRILDRKEDPGVTRFDLDTGARNLRLTSVVIHTGEPLFTRKISLCVREIAGHVVLERTVASGTIYRVAIEGQPVSADLDLDFDLLIPSRHLLLLIENGQSPPVPIDSIDIFRGRESLLFYAKSPGDYAIYTGNSLSTAPVYDIALLEAPLRGTGAAAVQPGSVAINPSYQPAESFSGVSPATPLDASAWGYRKEIRAEKSGVQQFELDLETLSHSKRDFADLRLVQNNSQFPYLLENTSSARND